MLVALNLLLHPHYYVLVVKCVTFSKFTPGFQTTRAFQNLKTETGSRAETLLTGFSVKPVGLCCGRGFQG